MTNNNNELHKTTGIDRRGFMKGIGATAGVATTGIGGTYYASRNVAAIPPLAIAGGVALGAIGAGYAIREVAKYVTGSEANDEDWEALEAQEVHALVREIAMDSYAADNSVLTNMENVLATAKNASYTDAQAAAVEAMDLGESKSAVITEAENAIDSFYSTTQKNLLDHVSIQNAKFSRLSSRLESTSGVSPLGVLPSYGANDSTTSEGYGPYCAGDQEVTGSKTLLNGSNYSYQIFSLSESQSDSLYYEFGINQFVDGYDRESAYTIKVTPVDTGAEEMAMDRKRYSEIWNTITSQHSQVVTDITSWIETVYPKYEQGDVDLENLVTSGQFASSAAEKTGYPFATADLAAAGIPIAEGLLNIELPEANDGSGATVDGTLSARQPPEGGFEVGTQYNPEEISGPIWMAYNYQNDQGEDASELIELEQPFVITEAETTEGESLDTVTMRSRNQRTLETDVQALNDELGQLADYQAEMQEKQEAIAEDSDNGGGGGGLPNTDDLFLFERFAGIPFWAWLSAGLTGIYGITQDE